MRIIGKSRPCGQQKVRAVSENHPYLSADAGRFTFTVGHVRLTFRW